MQINLSNIKIFTILISLFYIFGLVGVYFSSKILLAAILTALIIFFILRYNFSLKKSLILFFVFVLGTLRAQSSLNINSILKDITSNSAVLTGQIITSKDISYKNNKVKFYLNVKEADFLDGAKDNNNFKNINSKVLVSANLNGSIENNILIGNYIKIKGKFTIPNASTNPHQFNYKKYLENNDCFNILYADSKSFEVISSPKFSFKNLNDSWFYILKKFELTRNKIIEKHSKNIKSPKLEILGGIVFGDETINPDEKIKENFKNSGLLHLLAASGLNVALIYGIWWWIASVIKLPFNFSIMVGIVFVILYTFMTGFPPSIIRAGIMLIFVLIGKAIDRNVSSAALIFFAGFLMLLHSPKMLFDIGFQLSFAVTLGLILCCPVILSKFNNINENYKEKFKEVHGIKRYFLYLFTPINMISVILVPLIAQLWVIPLQMHYFNNLAPLSVLANIAVVPFIGLLSFVGFVGSIFALVPYFNDSIVYLFDLIANPLLGLLIRISELFGSFKISLISTIGMSLFQILCFWIILLFVTLNIQNNFKNKKEKIALILVIIAFILSFLKIGYFVSNTEISIFDTDKNGCVLIKTPNNKFVMYDIPTSKSGFSKTEAIINKYLQNERIKKLDYLIIPGFEEKAEDVDILLSGVKVGKIINYKNPQNREIVTKKDFKIESYILNKSISLFLNYKDKNLLLLDKCKVSDFKKIENNLPNKIDILKISPDDILLTNYAIDKLKPDYIIISDDTINSKILKLIYSKDIKLIQSKDYGFIKVILDKSDIHFYNFDKNNSKYKKIKFYDRVEFSKSQYIKKFLENNQ